jgi:hypothetical protein
MLLLPKATLVFQAGYEMSVLGTLALLVTLGFDFQPKVPFQRWSNCAGYLPAH